MYTRMAKRSLGLWADFVKQVNPDLLSHIGVLWMTKPGNVYAEQSRETLRKVGVSFDGLSAEDLARRYPQIRP